MCVSVCQYRNLDEKFVSDNQQFWRIVKPFVSDKVVGKDKIYLTETNEFLRTDLKTAEILNTILIISYRISIYEHSETKHKHKPAIHNVKNLILNPVSKDRYHPRIIVIYNQYKRESFSFSFSEVTKSEIAKELQNEKQIKPLKTLISK